MQQPCHFLSYGAIGRETDAPAVRDVSGPWKRRSSGRFSFHASKSPMSECRIASVVKVSPEGLKHKHYYHQTR